MQAKARRHKACKVIYQVDTSTKFNKTIPVIAALTGDSKVFCRSIFRSNLDAFHHLNACRQVGSAARAG